MDEPDLAVGSKIFVSDDYNCYEVATVTSITEAYTDINKGNNLPQFIKTEKFHKKINVYHVINKEGHEIVFSISRRDGKIVASEEFYDVCCLSHGKGWGYTIEKMKIPEMESKYVHLIKVFDKYVKVTHLKNDFKLSLETNVYNECNYLALDLRTNMEYLLVLLIDGDIRLNTDNDFLTKTDLIDFIFSQISTSNSHVLLSLEIN